jgi:C-terminal processing protease CtpA/Prc
LPRIYALTHLLTHSQDVILAIDGVHVEGLDPTAVMKKLRGCVGTSVELLLHRTGAGGVDKTIPVTLMRSAAPVEASKPKKGAEEGEAKKDTVAEPLQKESEEAPQTPESSAGELQQQDEQQQQHDRPAQNEQDEQQVCVQSPGEEGQSRALSEDDAQAHSQRVVGSSSSSAGQQRSSNGSGKRQEHGQDTPSSAGQQQGGDGIGFGIGLTEKTGGAESGWLTVAKLAPGGAAAASGLLRVGDVIQGITDVEGITAKRPAGRMSKAEVRSPAHGPGPETV